MAGLAGMSSTPLDELLHPAPLKARPFLLRPFLHFLIETPLVCREATLRSSANWTANTAFTNSSAWKRLANSQSEKPQSEAPQANTLTL
jgi:hypothetical protein